jgi:hypothetical protein
MVRRFFQVKRDGMTSDDQRFDGIADDASVHLTPSDPSGEDSYPEQGLSGGFDSFKEIYGRATDGAPASGYTILTVSAMLNSTHLAGMSTDSKRGSIMMALDAAGVHVTDILQDAMLRQRALEEYEEAQQKKLRAFEAAKGEANRKLQAELDRITAEYMSKIQANIDEVARQQDAYRVWLKSKQQESNTLAAASAMCTQSNNATAGGSYGVAMEAQAARR